MAEVSVAGGVLKIELTVSERVLALHGRDVEVPLVLICVVTGVVDALSALRGMRAPGAGIPGKLALGTWRGRSGGANFHDFVLVHHNGPGVVVTTTGEGYDRLVIGTQDPAALVAALRAPA
jgi:hypothetical protein